MAVFESLRRMVFDGDNRACFIERDRILARLEREMPDDPDGHRHARILSRVLAEVSVPVHEDDIFAGRVVEALPDEGMTSPNPLLWSFGHMSFDYAMLLRCGLKGILQQICENAQRLGDAESLQFAENSAIIVEAIRDYALRYADAAEKAGKPQMAKALRQAPYGPAEDLYTALQGMWMVHMIASCYVGARDYAFGRFDQYLLPYYEKALADGVSEEQIHQWLMGFFFKTNEICGRAAHNYKWKPIACHSSKQYVNIGGETPNALSFAVMKAIEELDMAQPELVVLLKPEVDEAFTRAVFETQAVARDRVNVYNYDQVVRSLLNAGVPESIAKDFTYSACCTMDLHYHSIRMEHYIPSVQIFEEVLHAREYESIDQILQAFTRRLREDMQQYVEQVQRGMDRKSTLRGYGLDSILLSDSIARCRYACDGQAPYNLLNMFFCGVATIGDSLMALDALVFQGKRLRYGEFMQILHEDWQGHEVLRQEVLAMPRFGNDHENDRYTRAAGEAFIRAVDGLQMQPNFYAAPGFYSLERDNSWADQVGATPDGRKKGTRFSENQSPTYGADVSGITALLKSVAKLPFDRAGAGGLNVSFSRPVPAETLQALTLSYFAMGGLHIGITVMEKKVLEDAMVHPEKYPTLTVRLYGFSEYFVALPDWQQQAVLERTAN